MFERGNIVEAVEGCHKKLQAGKKYFVREVFKDVYTFLMLEGVEGAFMTGSFKFVEKGQWPWRPVNVVMPSIGEHGTDVYITDTKGIGKVVGTDSQIMMGTAVVAANAVAWAPIIDPTEPYKIEPQYRDVKFPEDCGKMIEVTSNEDEPKRWTNGRFVGMDLGLYVVRYDYNYTHYTYARIKCSS